MNHHRTFPISARSAGIAVAALLAITLVGCNRRDDGQTAKDKIDAATTAVKRDAEQVAQSASQAMGDMKQATGAAAQTAVTAVEDTAITARIKASLAGDAGLKALDISVETTAGRTTLRGTAPDAAAQSRAQQLAAAVPGVSSVDNQLTVGR
jgi:osmotically-inducible protein OsmY